VAHIVYTVQQEDEDKRKLHEQEGRLLQQIRERELDREFKEMEKRTIKLADGTDDLGVGNEFPVPRCDFIDDRGCTGLEVESQLLLNS
jgi:hypothetical protein